MKVYTHTILLNRACYSCDVTLICIFLEKKHVIEITLLSFYVYTFMSQKINYSLYFFMLFIVFCSYPI